MSLPRQVIVVDGAGDRYEVCDVQATFLLRSLDDPHRQLRVDSATLRDLGIEWDGRTLQHIGGSS